MSDETINSSEKIPQNDNNSPVTSPQPEASELINDVQNNVLPFPDFSNEQTNHVSLNNPSIIEVSVKDIALNETIHTSMAGNPCLVLNIAQHKKYFVIGKPNKMEQEKLNRYIRYIWGDVRYLPQVLNAAKKLFSKNSVLQEIIYSLVMYLNILKTNFATEDRKVLFQKTLENGQEDLVIPADEAETEPLFTPAEEACDPKNHPYIFTHLHEGKTPTGKPLLVPKYRYGYIMEEDLFSETSEDFRNTKAGERITEILKANGIYKSVDGKTVYKISGAKIKEIPYEQYDSFVSRHVVFGKVCARDVEQLEGNKSRIVPVERDKDYQDILGFEDPQDSKTTFARKWVAKSPGVNKKRQLAFNLYKNLDEVQEISSPKLIADDFRSVLPYREGYHDGIFYKPIPHFQEFYNIYAGRTNEEYKRLLLSLPQRVFGRVPIFEANSAGKDALLAYILTTLFRNSLAAVPILWITTPHDNCQGVGKSWIPEQLQSLLGLKYDHLTLSDRKAFDLKQFSRDFQKNLTDPQKIVISIDNVVHKGDNTLANHDLLASFSVHQGETWDVKLTGEGRNVSCGNAKRIITLTGNNIHPLEGSDWNRRSIYIQLSYKNRSLNSGENKGLHYQDARALAEIMVIAYYGIKAYLEENKGNLFKAPDNTSNMYSSYGNFCRTIGGIVDWAYDGKSTFLADGKGRFISTESVKTKRQVFIEKWDTNFKGEMIQVHNILEHKEMKKAAADVLNKKEKDLTEAAVGRMLTHLADDGVLTKKPKAKAHFYCRKIRKEHREITASLTPPCQKPIFDTEEIKSRINIKDLAIGKQKTLKANEYRVCCPAHDDTNPSAHVTAHASGDIWHCFSCGAGGDVITFAQHLYNVDFVDACKQLGAKNIDAINYKELAAIARLREKKERTRQEAEKQEKINATATYLQSISKSCEQINCYLSARLKVPITGQEGFFDKQENIASVPLKDENGKITGIQRYYLNDNYTDCVRTEEGKRKKLSKGHIRGACVCIHKSTSDRAYIGEGLETMYAFKQLMDSKDFEEGSIYAAISSGNISNIDWLPEKEIVVVCDNDTAPEKAYQKLKESLVNGLKRKAEDISFIAPCQFGYGVMEDKQDFLDMWLNK